MHRCYMHRFFRCNCFLQNSSNSAFLWVLSSCFVLHGLFTSSLGSRNIHLTKPLVPLIALLLNHQNHKTMAQWGHFPYNLPLFDDWWQHNQSKHKFAKIDKLIPIENNWKPLTLAWMLTIIQWWLGLPLNPSSPFVSPHFLLLLLFFLLLLNQSCSPFGRYSFSPCFDPNFSLFEIKSPKKVWQTKNSSKGKVSSLES